MNENIRLMTSPTGAAIALICFFLPWLEFSCGELKQSMSGAEIGGIFWVVFAAAAIILLAYFYFRNQDELNKARPIILLCSLVALALLFYKYMDFKSGAQQGIAGLNQISQMAGNQQAGADPNMQMPEIGISLKFGGYGTIAGFLIALVGAFMLGSEGDSKAAKRAIISYYQTADTQEKKGAPV